MPDGQTVAINTFVKIEFVPVDGPTCILLLLVVPYQVVQWLTCIAPVSPMTYEMFWDKRTVARLMVVCLKFYKDILNYICH
jgi:hypothetical protein